MIEGERKKAVEGRIDTMIDVAKDKRLIRVGVGLGVVSSMLAGVDEEMAAQYKEMMNDSVTAIWVEDLLKLGTVQLAGVLGALGAELCIQAMKGRS